MAVRDMENHGHDMTTPERKLARTERLAAERAHRAELRNELHFATTQHDPRVAVPITHLRMALSDKTADEAMDLLAVILDEMGRVIAELDPTRLRDTVGRSGRFGWLRDGTPVIYL